jgi:hypothetical protein
MDREQQNYNGHDGVGRYIKTRVYPLRCELGEIVKGNRAYLNGNNRHGAATKLREARRMRTVEFRSELAS